MKTKIMKIKSGSVLVLAVVMVVILLIIGLAMITLASNARLQSVRSELGIAARTAADAGLAKAVALMKAKYVASPGSYNAAGTGGTQLITDVNNMVASSGTFYETSPTASYSYSISYDSTDKSWQIASTGKASGVQKTVYAKLTGTNHFFGMGLKLNLNAKNNDDFLAIASTSGLPFTVKTNSTTANAIDLSKSTIHGDVAVGYGGDPCVVIAGYKNSPNKVTGTVYASPNYTYPDAVPPSGLPAGPAPDSKTGKCTISQSCQYASIDAGGDVTIPANLGNIQIYVSGSMNFSNIIVNQGSSLSLYIGSDLTGKNNVTITTNNVDSSNGNNPDPTSVMIYGTAGVSSLQNITLKNNADVYAGIYAPNADVQLKNTGNVIGAVIASSFTFKNNCTFFYDTDFNNFNLSGVTPYYLEVARWWE